jgi:hypothetical protein
MVLRRFTVDKAALVVMLGIWWFVLRPSVRVVGAVDTVSYLAAIYSTWRVARSTIVTIRSLWRRVRRGEITEAGKDRGGVADLAGDPAERVAQHGVAGREDGGSR